MVNSTIELAPHDEEIRQIVMANEENIRAVFEKALRKGQARGQISTKRSPQALARFLLHSITGLRVAIRAKSPQALIDDIIDVSMDILE